MSNVKTPRRLTVGSIIKGQIKDGVKQQDYIKMSYDINLKKGEYLQLKSKEQQLQDLDEGVNAGRLSEESADKIRERVQKIPDFVRFELVWNAPKQQ